MALHLKRIASEPAAARRAVTQRWAGMSLDEVRAGLAEPDVLIEAVALLLTALPNPVSPERTEEHG